MKSGKCSETVELRHKWLSQIDSLHFVEQLFHHLQDTSFFAKDRDGRFMMGDQSFIQMLHRENLDDIIGKTDADFFVDHVARKYMRDDAHVMETAEPLLHEIEVVPQGDLSLNWHEANKFPIFDKNREVVGVAGVTIKLTPAHMPLNYPPNLGKILEFIGQNYGNKITISQLAEISSMSERSVERHFAKTFKMTPLRYLKQVRMNAACHCLSHTSKSIAEITMECGFYDQSHMSNEFRRLLNSTPRDYRIKNARNLT